MAEKLSIGMIGCGEIAVQTAKGIAASTLGQHVMVMDTDDRVAGDLGATYGVPHTTRVEELLANSAVTAVYIAVPHFLHAPLAIQAARAGKHVLVEKPIATTLAEADAMIAAARDAHVTLSVAYLAQVDPVAQTVRRLIAADAIGKVVGTRIIYRGDKPESYWHGGYSGRIQTDWRTSKAKSGGGVLIMNTIHDLNTLRFITGLEVLRVSAEYETFTTPVEVEDYVAVTYRYDNGAIGTLEAGSAIRGRDPVREVNRIYGDAGQVLFANPTRLFVTKALEGLKAGEWQDLPLPTGGAAGDRAAMIDGFAGAVLHGQPPVVRAEDGRAAIQIALAAYQSGQEHQTITLGPVLQPIR
ncbi:MAG: Gfo/Idh/MocA family protein [Chloroflexota bacterium]